MNAPKKDCNITFRVVPDTYSHLELLGSGHPNLAARAIVERALRDRLMAAADSPGLATDLEAVEALAREILNALVGLRAALRGQAPPCPTDDRNAADAPKPLTGRHADELPSEICNPAVKAPIPSNPTTRRYPMPLRPKTHTKEPGVSKGARDAMSRVQDERGGI